MNRRILIAFATASLAMILSRSTANAQSFPAGPVRLVVSYGAGGPTDIVARQVAQKLGEVWKQSVYVLNKPGALGTIGTFTVADAAPDGLTLLLGTAFGSFQLAQSGSQIPQLKQFEPIALLSVTPSCLVVRADLPVKSVRELIDYAKANPGKMNYGGVTGSPLHLTMEQLKRSQGLDMVFVPFTGSAQSAMALIGGTTDLAVMDPASALTAVNSGMARLIAAVGEQRLSLWPDVSTMSEQGFSGFDAEAWYGLFGPAGLPPNIRDKIASDILPIIGTAEARDQMKAIGIELRPGDLKQLREVAQRDIDRIAKAISDLPDLKR